MVALMFMKHQKWFILNKHFHNNHLLIISLYSYHFRMQNRNAPLWIPWKTVACRLIGVEWRLDESPHPKTRALV